jgi:hypothetical protein
MDIRMKAALRMAAVIGAGLIASVVIYLAASVVPDVVVLGVVGGICVGIVLYNLYRIFLAMEEMKESNKK